MVLALFVLALSSPASGQPRTALCKLETIPSDIKNRLTKEFERWKIQEATDLGLLAHKRWASEKPLACPGIAIGKFDDASRPSYAVLLVPRTHSDSAYKLLVFSCK